MFFFQRPMPVEENEYEINVLIKISSLLTKMHAFSLYSSKSLWEDDVEDEDHGNDEKKTMAIGRRI